MGGFTPKKAGDFNYDKFRFWMANQRIYALLPYNPTKGEKYDGIRTVPKVVWAVVYDRI